MASPEIDVCSAPNSGLVAGLGAADTEDRAPSLMGRPWRAHHLTVYGPNGETRVPLSPTRALTLAQELLTRGVQAIKADQWGAE